MTEERRTVPYYEPRDHTEAHLNTLQELEDVSMIEYIIETVADNQVGKKGFFRPLFRILTSSFVEGREHKFSKKQIARQAKEQAARHAAEQEELRNTIATEKLRREAEAARRGGAW